jgi:hypothetical protein
MRGFFDEQGRTGILAFGVLCCTSKAKIRGEHSSSEKDPNLKWKLDEAAVDMDGLPRNPAGVIAD